MSRAGPDLGEAARRAQVEVWQAHGRLRAGSGGGVLDLPGIRLMASGLPFPQWNNGDVTDPGLVDLRAVAEFYAARGLPWGVRVPAGLAWPHGRLLFRQRCMAARLPAPASAPAPAGVTLRVATQADLDAAAHVDATAFGDPVEADRAWLAPQIGAPRFGVVLADLGGRLVGTATAVRTSAAGVEGVGVYGVGVLPEARGRGIGAALASYAMAAGAADGATLAHLNPDTEAAARLYARLGFTETPGFDVYVDNVPR